MIAVSVIIPIYNAGSYLKDCLLSLSRQTLSSIEFILVLDCPSDGSDSVAKEFAQQDERFVIVENTQNLHIGNSRNAGLAHARGEYVAFCDHDDIMEATMYASLYADAQAGDYDLVLSNPTLLIGNQTDTLNTPNYTDTNLRDCVLHDLISGGGKDRNTAYFCNLHNNLYRRNLIEAHHLQFVDTRSITPEDVLFNIEATWHAQRVNYINQSFYSHRIHQESAGHQQAYIDWRKRYNGVEYVYHFLNKQQAYSTYCTDFYLSVQKQFLNGLLGTIYHRLSFAATKEAYQTMKRAPYCKEAFSHYQAQPSRKLSRRLLRRITAELLAH